MPRTHFFYSIQVGAQANLRYHCAVTAVHYVMFPFFFLSLFQLLLSNIYVPKRVSCIQLVVTWCTLQQHSSMHLTTSSLTSTGIP